MKRVLQGLLLTASFLLILFGVILNPLTSTDTVILDRGPQVVNTDPVGPVNEWVELEGDRTRSSKLFYNAVSGEYMVTSSLGSVHYQEDASDPDSPWLEIDTDIVASDLPAWDWEMTKAQWNLRVRNDATVAAYVGDNWVEFKLVGLAYLGTTGDYTVISEAMAAEPEVEANCIRWNDIIDGVNFVLYVGADLLKEEIEVTQAARDRLADQAPEAYGYTADAMLAPVFECDWSGAGLPELADGETVDLTDWEGEANLFFGDPVKGEIVAALPMGYIYHEDDSDRDNTVDITTKFTNQGGTDYLLMGVPVQDVYAMAPGTVIYDPTLNTAVAASGDDCWWRPYLDSWSSTTGKVSAGYEGSTDRRLNSSMRFTGVSLPSDAVVSSAYFTVVAFSSESGSSVCSKIVAENVYNATQIADQTDYNTRLTGSIGTEYVYWDNIASFTAGNSYNSADFTDVVQEVVDDNSGTGSGFQIWWGDWDDRTSHSAGDQHRDGASYDNLLSYDPPEITITYSTSATISTSDATDITATTARLNGNIVGTGGDNPTVTVYWGDNDGGTVEGNWDYSSAPTSPSQPQGVAAFYKDITGLTRGVQMYFSAKAVNISGTNWGTTQTFTPGARYWVGNGGDWDNTAHWSYYSGGPNGYSPPTSSDDAYFDANSFTSSYQSVCLSGTSNVCRDLILTGSGSDNPKFEDDSGSGDLDLSVYGDITWESGWTFVDWNSTGENYISVHSNSTLTSCAWGDTTNAPELWIISGTATLASTTTVKSLEVVGGTFDINSQTFTTGRDFNGNGGAYDGTVVMSGGATTTGYMNLEGGGSFNNLTLESTTKIDCVTLTDDITVSGTLTMTGYDADTRLMVRTSSGGTQQTITAATVSSAYTDFYYIEGAGAGDWDLSAAGEDAIDWGSNTGITFAWPYSSTRDYYWTGLYADGGGGGTWSTTRMALAAAYNWSTTSGGTGGAKRLPPPGTGNDVYFDANSGFGIGNDEVSVSGEGTVDYIECHDLDFTGCGAVVAPTICHGGSFAATLRVTGDLTFISGMDFDWQGHLGDDILLDGSGDVIFAGFEFDYDTGGLKISGNYTFHDDITFAQAGTPQAVRWEYLDGTIDTTTYSVTITYEGGVDGSWHDFMGGGQTYYAFESTGNEITRVTGENTFTNFTRTSTSGTFLDELLFGADQYITNLTWYGYSAMYRLHVGSTVYGTQRQITAANVAICNCDISDIAGVGTGDWDISGCLNQDMGGNLGITFTTPIYVYWVGNSGSWSDEANHWAVSSGGTPGTARMPLIQDVAIFDENSFTIPGRVVSIDVPNLSGIDAEYVANTPTFSKAGQVDTYGSVILGTVTWNVTTTRFCGLDSGLLSSSVMNTDLHVFKNSVYMSSLYLGANLEVNGDIYVDSGTFNHNGWDVTADIYDSSTTTYDRAIRLGSGSTTLDATGSCTKVNMDSTNLDFFCETSTLILTNSGTSTQTWASGGLTYNNVIQQGAGVWTMSVTGSPTVYELKIDRSEASKTISGGVTITMQLFNLAVQGSNTITISATDFSMATGIVLGDYLNIANSAAGGGAAFFANVGGNSVNSGGNSGWIWGPPTAPTVETQAATDITEAGATLNGEVLTAGSYPTLLCYFEYGATVAYGWETTGDVLTAIGAFDDRLTPYHPYHYRAVIEFGLNDHVYGNDMTVTLSGDTGEATAAVSDPGVDGGTVLVDEAPDEIPGMYDEGNTDGIPFAPLVDPALDGADIPTELFWFPIAFLIAIALGFVAYHYTRRFLIQAIVSGAVMAFFCGGGVLGPGLLPYLTVVLFGIEAFLIVILQEKQYT